MIISSYTLRVKPNATYSTHFLLVLQKVLRETETAVRYEIIKKIVPLKVRVHSLMNLEFILSKVARIS